MRGFVSRCRHAVALAALAVLPVIAQAPTDERIALVIGNASYPSSPLVNPLNDARAMAETLRGLGFKVLEVHDGSRAQMDEAITSVRDKLKGKRGVGMLYYAGHGLQVDWNNYMVPVDARLASTADVQAQAVNLSRVIEAFTTAGNRMNILVLDACRDNPFAGTATGKGLAPLDAPPGTLLAYATAPGNVAADGEVGAANGLYTGYLLQELKKPIVKIEDVFKRVRLQVRQKSQGRQIPWESTSLEEDFVFNSGKVVVAEKPDNRAREEAFAREKIDWDAVQASSNVDAYYDFLKKHPSGSWSEMAQSRIERLQKAQVQAQPERDARAQGSFEDRFREGDRYSFVITDGLTGVQTARADVVIRLRGEDEAEGVATGTVGARSTRAGFVVEDGGGRYDPPWAVVPGGEFQVGKKLSARSIQIRRDGSRQWMDYDSRIVAREKIRTPFGEVDTYRIEVDTVFQNGVRARRTFWFEPGWGYSVKLRSEVRRGNAAPDIQIRDMVSRSRGT